jgi:hypothetical protein
MSHITTAVHVFVEIERNKQVKLEFENADVTGHQIKEKAGIPLDDDLALRHGQKLELITNDQPVTLTNGEHFVALPPGTIS